MKKCLKVLKGLAALTSFATVIPAKVYDVSLAAEYFYLISIVGVLEGLITSVPILIPTSPYLRAAMALAASYLVTGLNHLDGLADFADAAYSGKVGEEALKVMKDPRRGSAAIAITSITLILTYASLVSVISVLKSWLDIAASLCIVHALAAESMYALAVTGKEPPYRGLGKLFIESSKPPWKTAISILTLASVLTLILVFRMPLLFPALSAAAAAAVSLAVIRHVSLRILGFISGDVLGAVFEVSKTTSLLTLAVILTAVTSCIIP